MEPFSGNPRILSAATAVPPHRVGQEEIKEFARNLFAGKFRDLERLLPIFDNGLIEARYFCQPLEWFGQEWSFPERNALYIEHALELSEKAARRGQPPRPGAAGGFDPRQGWLLPTGAPSVLHGGLSSHRRSRSRG